MGAAQLGLLLGGFDGGEAVGLDHVVLEDLNGAGHGAQFVLPCRPGDLGAHLPVRQAAHGAGQRVERLHDRVQDQQSGADTSHRCYQYCKDDPVTGGAIDFGAVVRRLNPLDPVEVHQLFQNCHGSAEFLSRLADEQSGGRRRVVRACERAEPVPAYGKIPIERIDEISIGLGFPSRRQQAFIHGTLLLDGADGLFQAFFFLADLGLVLHRDQRTFAGPVGIEGRIEVGDGDDRRQPVIANISRFVIHR
nr:hypothetical protein [Azospirillum palustre]